jgi:hypothetical protein
MVVELQLHFITNVDTKCSCCLQIVPMMYVIVQPVSSSSSPSCYFVIAHSESLGGKVFCTYVLRYWVSCDVVNR